jgi:PPM family protein phosphatase
MAKKKIKYSIGNHTHKGMVRKINQDSFGSIKSDQGDLYIVADGMGGHKGGETASKITVETLCDAFKNSNVESPQKFLNDTLLLADANVRKKAENDTSLKGMGSTAVAIIIKGTTAYYAHVGDSRMYLFRNKKGNQLTIDHSYVQQLVEKGIIKAEEAENHPEKNKILQAIGVGNVSPDSSQLELYKHDVLLLCSDGLSGEVSIGEMQLSVNKKPPMESCKELVSLANDRGGPDNSTVIILKIDEGDKAPKGTLKKGLDDKKHNFTKPAVIGLSVLSLLVFATFYFRPIIKIGKKSIAKPDLEAPQRIVPADSSKTDSILTYIDSTISDSTILEYDSTKVDTLNIKDTLNLKTDSLEQK